MTLAQDIEAIVEAETPPANVVASVVRTTQFSPDYALVQFSKIKPSFQEMFADIAGEIGDRCRTNRSWRGN